MFGKTKIFWLTLLLGVILLAGWWFLSNDQKITLAIGPAPTVALSGDDYNLTGGTDDPYDSFLLIRPQSNQNYFLDYLLDYSADSGRHWQLVPAETRIINGAIPNPTPVLYWDFEEGNGTTIHNRVGSDTATVNGSFAWQQSFFNQAVNFTGGFLSPLSANLVNSSAGTISFWLYPANLTNQQYIFRYCTDGACNSNNRLYFRLEPDGTAAFGISNVAVNLGMVMPNVWQHFAVSYSGGLFQIYKNGVQVQNGAFNAFVINNPMTIVPLIGGTAYNGYLDEVKIFSQGLNVGQVSDIYNGVNNLQNNLSYYWPLNSLGNQDLNLRVRVKTAQGISNASLQTIRLRHRFGSRGRNYFVENFLTQTWQGSGSPGWWNVASGSLQFSNQSVNCPGGVIRPISTDLLTGLAGKLVITKITWQAAQMVENNSSIAYEFSTDGVNWQPGLTANNTSVTNPQIITLAQPGTSLYWRASLTRGNSCAFVDQPKIYSIRLAWEYNHDPRACFKVSPTRSANPDQVFTFTSSCSADAEDAPAQLTYQWDFNQDGQIDNQGQTVTHSFGTTTPQTISLKVRDTFNASSTFSQSINPALFLGGKVNGWGWSPNWGWLSLNCENIYNGITAVLCKRNGQGRANYGLEIDDADYSLNGYAWSDSLGWVCFGKTCTSQGLTPDGSAAHLIISVTDGSLSGWAKVMSLGEEGWLRLDDPEHPAFNVRFNSSTQSLEGLAWGAAQDPANGIFYGLGPIDFNKSFTSYPWLETKYGNIYSLGGLGSANMAGAPSSSVVSGGVRYNATYCLLTNGKIVNFKTQSRNCLRPDYSRINFPEPGNKYQTPLGFLPMNELKTKATKTGTAMEDVSDLNTYFSSTKVLNNRVYYFSGFGDYTISDPITFLNNVASNGSGAGTIVVAGNLHVNANLFYEDSKLIGKIGNLASVAFIVLGDVIIDPAVDHLVGSWLVLGNDSLEACLNGTNICGQFSTGNDTAAPTQLTVQGLVLARKFNLQRNFRQGLEAAEKFIYDGRVNVNTPPGLSSVSFNLPQWNGQ